jgi:hypothetical protein
VSGKQHLLHLLLVPGLKVWHLRPNTPSAQLIIVLCLPAWFCRCLATHYRSRQAAATAPPADHWLEGVAPTAWQLLLHSASVLGCCV